MSIKFDNTALHERTKKALRNKRKLNIRLRQKRKKLNHATTERIHIARLKHLLKAPIRPSRSVINNSL